MSIRKEEPISQPLSEETSRNRLNQLRKACKVYDPSVCEGYPACEECINLLC